VTFTFLQLSDVHLDSPQNHGVISYGPAQRAERYADLVEALVNALMIGRDRNVDAVFIAGGLWNHDTIRSTTAGTVLEALEELGATPVYILPSDSDPFTIESPYNSRFLSARGMRGWPRNAVIFKSSEFVTHRHPTRPEVTVTGFASTTRTRVRQRLLSEPVCPDERGELSILLYHGSLDSYGGMDGMDPTRVSAPFSKEELGAQGFTYAALGHHHEYTEVRDDEGLLLGAYSGCLAGRNFEEIGPRVAVIGTIENGQTSLEPVEVSRNRLMYIAVDVSGLDYEALKEEIVISMEEQDVRPEEDIVTLVMDGRYSQGAHPEEVIHEIQDAFRRLIIVDRTRPDYLSEEFDPRTTEATFVENMLDRMHQAEELRQRETVGDSLTGIPAFLSGKTVEDALYYGLDALKHRKVTVRHVD